MIKAFDRPTCPSKLTLLKALDAGAQLLLADEAVTSALGIEIIADDGSLGANVRDMGTWGIRALGGVRVINRGKRSIRVSKIAMRRTHHWELRTRHISAQVIE